MYLTMTFYIKTLVFLLLINICYSKPKVKPAVFKIIERDNNIILEKENSDFNPHDVLKLAKNYADVTYRIDNILNKKPIENLPDGSHPLGEKRVLVKRIIPTGKETPDLEFDVKHNTYFKPLVKIHKVKKLQKGRSEILTDLSSELSMETSGSQSDSEEDEPILIKERYPPGQDSLEIIPLQALNDVRELSDEPNTEEEVGARYISDILKMIPLLTPSKQWMAKRKLVSIMADLDELHEDILDNLLHKVEPLRVKNKEHLTTRDKTFDLTPQEHTGVDLTDFEDNETLNQFNKEAISAMEKKKRQQNKNPNPVPHNPLWNYWTYKKTLVLDGCPGNQVNVGNICIWTPEHRRKTLRTGVDLITQLRDQIQRRRPIKKGRDLRQGHSITDGPGVPTGDSLEVTTPENKAEETTLGDTTVEETTLGDTTVEDTTLGDTTVEDTTVEETTTEYITFEDETTTVQVETEPPLDETTTESFVTIFPEWKEMKLSTYKNSDILDGDIHKKRVTKYAKPELKYPSNYYQKQKREEDECPTGQTLMGDICVYSGPVAHSADIHTVVKFN